MIEENSDIRDKYMLCYTYGMEAHMTKVSYDDINCALQEDLEVIMDIVFYIYQQAKTSTSIGGGLTKP